MGHRYWLDARLFIRYYDTCCHGDQTTQYRRTVTTCKGFLLYFFLGNSGSVKVNYSSHWYQHFFAFDARVDSTNANLIMHVFSAEATEHFHKWLSFILIYKWDIYWFLIINNNKRFLKFHLCILCLCAWSRVKNNKNVPFQRLRELIRPQLKPHQIPAQYSVTMRPSIGLDISQESSRGWDNPAFTASPVFYESNV